MVKDLLILYNHLNNLNNDIMQNEFYAVMKLNTDIEVVNPFTGEKENIKLGGLAGYIPVFSTIEEATESAQNGKYQILGIQSLKQ